MMKESIPASTTAQTQTDHSLAHAMMATNLPAMDSVAMVLQEV